MPTYRLGMMPSEKAIHTKIHTGLQDRFEAVDR